MMVASPDKSLYISITPESAIHSPSAPPPSSVCLLSLLACYQARYCADGVPLFLIGSLRRGGVAKTPIYISFVAGLFGAEQLVKQRRQNGEVTRLLLSRTIAFKNNPNYCQRT